MPEIASARNSGYPAVWMRRQGRGTVLKSAKRSTWISGIRSRIASASPLAWGIAFISGFVVFYAAASIGFGYFPDAMPEPSSMTAAAMWGPALLAVWGFSAAYWISTFSLIGLLAIAAASTRLAPVATMLFFAVWAGSGFLSIAMSI